MGAALAWRQSAGCTTPEVTADECVRFVVLTTVVLKINGRSGNRIPLGARFSAPVQTGPGVHPASCTMGTGSFPGVNRPGRGVDHAPPSSAEVKERVELYLYSPSGPSWPVIE
jgi:hypothetical protein